MYDDLLYVMISSTQLSEKITDFLKFAAKTQVCQSTFYGIIVVSFFIVWSCNCFVA